MAWRRAAWRKRAADAFAGMREEKHIIVDVSHGSAKRIEDVLALATRPLVVSHAGVRGTCNNNRNLSDDQLRAIAKNGGLIGIMSFFAFTYCFSQNPIPISPPVFGDGAKLVVGEVAVVVAGAAHTGMGHHQRPRCQRKHVLDLFCRSVRDIDDDVLFLHPPQKVAALFAPGRPSPRHAPSPPSRCRRNG